MQSAVVKDNTFSAAVTVGGGGGSSAAAAATLATAMGDGMSGGARAPASTSGPEGMLEVAGAFDSDLDMGDYGDWADVGQPLHIKVVFNPVK